MTLREKQSRFIKDLAYLIFYADSIGVELTGGELYRTEYQQAEHLRQGKSKTMKSKHLQRLAIDFNFFLDGQLTYDKKKLSLIGAYWESIRKENKWGGNFKSFVDTPHFQSE